MDSQERRCKEPFRQPERCKETCRERRVKVIQRPLLLPWEGALPRPKASIFWVDVFKFPNGLLQQELTNRCGK